MKFSYEGHKMRTKVVEKLFALATLFVAGMCVAQEMLPAETRSAIDKGVEEALAKSGVPSASIAIVKDGKLAYAKAYGIADLSTKKPATTDMRYSVGSISKQFTAAAVMMLVEEGKLSLDDKVGKFFPKLTRANEITLRQLLTMTSGYQDYWPQDYLMPEMMQPTTAQHILDKWAGKPLDFEPGTKYQYSNTNYVIAGLIVEKASGMPIFDLLQKRVFTPLKMTSVMDIDKGRLTESDPVGYERYALGPSRPAHKEGVGWIFAAGELAMTPTDLAKWNISFMNRTLLKPESYRAMQTTVLLKNGFAPGYGLGLDVGMNQGRFFVAHTGEVMGFVASNRVWPDEKVSVVVLTNQMTSGAGQIEDCIRDVLFPPLDETARSSEGKVRKSFMELQQGRIDRAQFTDNANAYFSDVALKDFANSLRPLGGPTEMNPGPRRMRGGFIIQSYRPTVGGKRLRISVFETTEGKFEQFLVEPAD
ncbi:MAG TPA: serine hydrolase domain-containing protein [Terriglobales bacterium]|nr:serine hydrolase domain-containing protein [Terriglobales bacterium]